MTTCPTCGAVDFRGYARIRRGGIVRVQSRFSRWLKKGTPNSSVRVYWPQGKGFRSATAVCPDPFHTAARNWRRRVYPKLYAEEPPNVEPYTGLNRHDPEVSGRRKAKARRHRDAQSKGRR